MAINDTAIRQFRSRAAEWTMERVAKLEREEIEQLRTNALGLGEQQVAALCEAALANCPKRRHAVPAKKGKAQRLVSRSAAFEARGVYLENARTSWGGVRKSDGVVVMGLWADAVKSRDGGCGCLLWAPNVDGSHPWSDSAPGQERLKHCRLVMAGAAAEGLLVFGERLAGHMPEEKARSVHGVDPQTVVHFKVEKRGEQYWAIWGKRTNGAPRV
ncbi:MAG: hypothetical protein E6H57_05020 [Betaproteobacteria bacterium]|nr:MAG: hypothetical protein E6H57_05020 [Betaproteobacteria bacterium]